MPVRRRQTPTLRSSTTGRFVSRAFAVANPGQIHVEAAIDTGRAIDVLARAGRGAPRAVRDALDAVQPVLLAQARALTPVGPGPRPGADPDSDDALPHIRDTLDVRSAGGTVQVISRHPGAPVHEFGGTIKPSGHPIRITRSFMANRAAQIVLPLVEDLIAGQIDDLAA
jgi:hypothetical protein